MQHKSLEDLEAVREKELHQTPVRAAKEEIDSGENKYKNWIHLARAVDSWRIFPRIFITTYMVLLYQVVHWFMGIGEDATPSQAGLVSVLVGAGAAWFGLYSGVVLETG
uniref:Uncharacterized protein n=1 Tax=Candidatus Kentrum sp. LFY TaxID=2126342 RepID=A0A450VEP4_9GAMM|nr:MAG: hypothetical protein BECKLFY1418A_GA0070994_12641 [Candidatus Kentron sp. LFY]